MLDFEKFDILTPDGEERVNRRYLATVKPLPIYHDLSVFNMQPSIVLNFKKFAILTVDGLKRVNVRNRAKFRSIGQTVTEISRFFNFQDGGCSPCCM